MPRPLSPLRGTELALAAAVNVVAAAGVVAALTYAPPPACRPASPRVLAAVQATLGQAPPPSAPPLAQPVVLTPGARLVHGQTLAAERPPGVLLAGYVEDRGRRHGPGVWEVTVGGTTEREPLARDLAAAALSPGLGADLDDDGGVVGTVRACTRDAAR